MDHVQAQEEGGERKGKRGEGRQGGGEEQERGTNDEEERGVMPRSPTKWEDTGKGKMKGGAGGGWRREGRRGRGEGIRGCPISHQLYVEVL